MRTKEPPEKRGQDQSQLLGKKNVSLKGKRRAEASQEDRTPQARGRGKSRSGSRRVKWEPA